MTESKTNILNPSELSKQDIVVICYMCHVASQFQSEPIAKLGVRLHRDYYHPGDKGSATFVTTGLYIQVILNEIVNEYPLVPNNFFSQKRPR